MSDSKRSALKYELVKRDLVQQITGNTLGPGGRLPSESELMARFSVSRQTVRQAIGELVADGLVVREKGRGAFVRVRRELASDKVAVLVPSLRLYTYPLFIEGMGSVLRKVGHQLVLMSTEWNWERERECIAECLEQRVAGVIVFPVRSAEENPNLDLFNQLLAHRIPVVMCVTPYAGLRAPVVAIDFEVGGYDAARQLLAAGHRRLAVLLKTREQASLRRLDGIRRALAEVGLALDDEWIGTYMGPGDSSDPDARAFIQRLVRRHPATTALICQNDLNASHALAALKEGGLVIPDDYSIVGFDDSDLASVTSPPLSTFFHPAEAVGAEAARLLHRMMGGAPNLREVPHRVLFYPEFVPRGTIGPPPPGTGAQPAQG